MSEDSNKRNVKIGLAALITGALILLGLKKPGAKPGVELTWE